MRRAVVAAYRARLLFFATAVLLLAAGEFTRWLAPDSVFPAVAGLLILLTLVSGALLVLLGRRCLPQHASRVVTSPVEGRWLALNSPASRVPSHGVRAYGQAYAIDLVAEPPGRPRPSFGSGASMRPPSDYPAFGEPVMAMIDGTVVRASGWRRDHRSRSSLLAVVYMMVEGALRELGGPGFIVGNHVVIRGADGTHAVVAHLQRGSVAVRRGESVRAGEVIGRCGNSGNSSEPHVHAHLMDRASFMFAVGLPMAFRGITLDDEVVDGLPENERHLTAPRCLSTPSR
ncbi:M23 family metallopeptidase [Micrococcales bacterium 31B]|nr:M23 family metallopeptidase [Micrococcales bacterium 31B]